MSNVVWSASRADCAMQCMYKYNKVYNDKIKESSHALTLGSAVHEILADEICSRNEDPNVLEDRLSATLDCSSEELFEGATSVPAVLDTEPDVAGFIPNISKFVKWWNAKSMAEGLEATIEKQYAIDSNFKSVPFDSEDAWIRGVFDMYAYDEANKKLIIIDHKTNKSKISAAKVKTHVQLNLYVVMLTEMFGLDWETADICLHFVRFGDLVWATVTREEMEIFKEKYTKLLNILEDRLFVAEQCECWEAQPSFTCGWCSFKSECPAHAPKIL